MVVACCLVAALVYPPDYACPSPLMRGAFAGRLIAGVLVFSFLSFSSFFLFSCSFFCFFLPPAAILSLFPLFYPNAARRMRVCAAECTASLCAPLRRAAQMAGCPVAAAKPPDGPPPPHRSGAASMRGCVLVHAPGVDADCARCTAPCRSMPCVACVVLCALRTSSLAPQIHMLIRIQLNASFCTHGGLPSAGSCPLR